MAIFQYVSGKYFFKKEELVEGEYLYIRMVTDDQFETTKNRKDFNSNYSVRSKKEISFGLGDKLEPHGDINEYIVYNKSRKLFFIGSDDTRMQRIGAHTKDNWFIQKIDSKNFHPYIGIMVKYEKGKEKITIKYYAS